MAKRDQLKYLISLVDDDTSEVREEVLKELGSYGMALEEDIQEYSNILTDQQLSLLQPLIYQNRRIQLRQYWGTWFNASDETEKIERAITLISCYHYGYRDIYELPNLLEDLSEEFLIKRPYGDELDLANFLFQEKGLRGAKENYYNPFHSNPLYTIKEKKGLPITLAIIYILTGNRLGYDIRGCNFPGHFLAKFRSEKETILVDCFNGGKFFYEKDLDLTIPDSKENFEKIIHQDASAFDIVRRVLKNLIGAYSFINEIDNLNFFKELLEATPR